MSLAQTFKKRSPIQVSLPRSRPEAVVAVAAVSHGVSWHVDFDKDANLHSPTIMFRVTPVQVGFAMRGSSDLTVTLSYVDGIVSTSTLQLD